MGKIQWSMPVDEEDEDGRNLIDPPKKPSLGDILVMEEVSIDEGLVDENSAFLRQLVDGAPPDVKAALEEILGKDADGSDILAYAARVLKASDKLKIGPWHKKVGKFIATEVLVESANHPDGFRGLLRSMIYLAEAAIEHELPWGLTQLPPSDGEGGHIISLQDKHRRIDAYWDAAKHEIVVQDDSPAKAVWSTYEIFENIEAKLFTEVTIPESMLRLAIKQGQEEAYYYKRMMEFVMRLRREYIEAMTEVLVDWPSKPLQQECRALVVRAATKHPVEYDDEDAKIVEADGLVYLGSWKVPVIGVAWIMACKEDGSQFRVGDTTFTPEEGARRYAASGAMGSDEILGAAIYAAMAMAHSLGLLDAGPEEYFRAVSHE